MDCFKSDVANMNADTRKLTKQYLLEMISTNPEHDLRNATAVFSYPPRGGKNDGNPALIAIMQLIPKSRLTVEENEYTRQRAIWLCEDFTVTWPRKQSQAVLTQALQHLCSLEQ